MTLSDDDREYRRLAWICDIDASTQLLRLIQIGMMVLTVWCVLTGMCLTSDIRSLEKDLHETRELALKLEETVHSLSDGGRIVVNPMTPPSKVVRDIRQSRVMIREDGVSHPLTSDA